MANVTFVIPVGIGHETLSQRAIDSVLSQTVPATYVTVHDTERRGAGWARNQGLAQVSTDFVVFLDADDVIAPDFVERTLTAWKPHHYVYTDWWEGERYVNAPDCAWVNRTWHVVTTLLRTEDARVAGGFDESLPGAEDTDFYLKLRELGICGTVLHEPLFAYSNEGERARRFVHGKDYARIHDLFSQRYGKSAGRCGGSMELKGHPDGVEAVALWKGNRSERGRVTGYLYPRCGNNNRLLVHPADIHAAPHLFQMIVRRESTVPEWVPRERDSFRKVVDLFEMGVGFRHERPHSNPKPVGKVGTPAPNVDKLLELYGECVV